MQLRLLFGVLAMMHIAGATAQVRFTPELEVRVDTTLYEADQSPLFVQGRRILAFPVSRPDQIIDVFFSPPEGMAMPVAKLQVARDISILDSLRVIDSSYFQARVQFSDLSKAGIIPITVAYNLPGLPSRLVTYELFPYMPTRAVLQVKDEEVFLGEEKSYVVATTNLGNIRVDGSWQTRNGVDYRLFTDGNQLRLSIVTNDPGLKEIALPLQTIRPIVAEGRLTNDLPPIALRFVAKSSRIAFLSFDRKEITLDLEAPQGTEIQIDRSRQLQIRKTYRIETTAEPGGAFVGEIFTRSSLSNDKVLAWIRPYALHRASDGYLYIKDGDDVKFITNINITEKTRIQRVSLRHQGGEFGENLTVNPGEQVDVKIQGTGLEKVVFLFEGAQNLVRDSALSTENVAVYSLRIPVNIARRKVVVYRGKEPTGFELTVKEFQTPRQLDFLTLNYGAGDMEVGKLTKPILYDKTIPELTLKPVNQVIDAGGKLYGKQYLVVEINIFNTRKDLIETRKIDGIVVCPGDNSPRFGFYEGNDCVNAPRNLNQFLAHKTFDLPDWATIELTIRHDPFKYGGAPGFSQKVELILQKHLTFDIDVSFPAGLLVLETGSQKFDNLYGISMAVLPQLSFYKPDKVNQLRPYRLGLGFIALNAFNFSNTDDQRSRDVGAVLLGSLFPTRTGSRFTFPLYGGFGYKLRAGRFFYIVGPGIQVRL